MPKLHFAAAPYLKFLLRNISLWFNQPAKETKRVCKKRSVIYPSNEVAK
jgi:hypothetical protein